MPNQLKFVSLPDRLLAGVDTHHHHLLTEEFGDNYFPAETHAIGTGVFQGNEIIGLGFDFGTDEDRRHAIEQIKVWAAENGYEMEDRLYDIYKQAGIYDKNFDFENAFWYYKGKLYVGQNHPVLVNAVTSWDDLDWEDPGVFGWVLGGEDGTVAAEIHSDSYAQEYNEDEIREMLVLLRERWPITEITYGPDAETIREMEEYFDIRESAIRYIDKVQGL